MEGGPMVMDGDRKAAPDKEGEQSKQPGVI